MAYKKFIKKDGKIYGPYVYHSRRENGEVVTSYLGKKENSYRKLFLTIASIVLVLALVFFVYRFVSLGSTSTGNLVLQLDTDYKPNESLNGVLKFALDKGEFVPADSDVLIKFENESYTYKLKDVVSVKPEQGTFFIDKSDISGEGEGFGSAGVKEIYPEVNFELEIFNSDAEVIEEPESSSETPTSGGENETVEETPTGEGNETVETSGETNEPEIPVEETPEITEETPVEETPTEEETINEPTTEASAEVTESGSETASVSEEPTESPATGNFVRTISGLVVSSDVVDSISGSVSYGTPFEFELTDGTTASVRSSSVSVNGEIIDDSYIEISIDENVAVVTTKYNEKEEGFGEEYLDSGETYSLELNLSILNLTAREGDMEITLSYNDVKLAETSTNIKIDTENLVKSNQTIELEDVNLTDEDIQVLKDKLGTTDLRTSRAEIVNNRLVIRYDVGKYWREYSYDYDNSAGITESLNSTIEFERNYWLKTLAGELAKNATVENEKIDSLLRDFSLENDNEEVNNESIVNETQIIENEPFEKVPKIGTSKGEENNVSNA